MSTWVKVHDTLRGNRKSLAAGERAMWLYVCALSYANEHETDGFVARIALPAVAPGVRGVERLAATLVAVEYWHPVGEEGWEINDYLDFQRSSQEIRADKEANAGRQTRYRERQRNGRNAVSNAVSNAPVTVLDKSREEEKRTTTPLSAAPTTQEPSPMIVALCQRLADWIVKNDPKAKPAPRSHRWLTDMRLLVDDRMGETVEVARMIDWCQADPFWRSNILSPSKLRKQFSQLVLKSGPPYTNVQKLRADDPRQNGVMSQEQQAAIDAGDLEAYRRSFRNQPAGDAA